MNSLHDTFWAEDHSLSDCSETEVRDKFLKSFLTALGWADSEWRSELWVDIQTGSTPEPKKLDSVICDVTKITKAPRSTRTYAPSGASYLIFEFKKSTENFEKAKRQAFSYSYHIEAPLYIVIDGIYLELCATYSPLNSAPLVRASLNDLSSARNEIEKYLHRSKLFDFIKILKSRFSSEFAQLVDAADKLAKTRQWTDIQLDFDPNAQVIQWIGPSPDSTVSHLWGTVQDPNCGNPVAMRVNAPLRTLPANIAEVILRLAIHGGIQTLYVPDPDDWEKAAKLFVRHDLGRDGIDWLPRRTPGREVWCINAIESHVANPAVAASVSFAAPLFARSLQDAMDGWCWNRMTLIIDDLCIYGQSQTFKGVSLHDTLRTEVSTRWTLLRTQLDAAGADLLRHNFMRAMLVPAGEGDLRAAALRLGRRTADQLTTGVVLTLTLAAALQTSCLARQPDSPISVTNVDFLGDLGHLLALDSIGGRPIFTALIDQLSREPRPLILPQCQASHSDLTSIIHNWTAIGRDPLSTRNSNTQRLDHVATDLLVFTLPATLRHHMENGGLTTVSDYIKKLIASLVQRYAA